MPRGWRHAYKIIFQETTILLYYTLLLYYYTFWMRPSILLSFSLTHLLMFYANADPPFLSPSPLLCPCSTDESHLTSLSLTSQHIFLTFISLHHYRRINWLERIQGGKWKTIFSKSRSQPLSTCPSDLWDICVMGFFINTTGKFLTHLNARRFEKNALIQNVISNFNSQLSTLMVGFFGGKRTEKNWCIRSR